MLTEQQIADFHRLGYLAVDNVADAEDVQRVRELLDPLFARFHALPANRAIDLGDERTPQGQLQIAEINRPVHIESRLKQTQAFVRCREIAGQLLRRTAYYSYDHAIYKPAHNHRATPWHQDQAYTGHTTPMRTIHFWVALQDVNELNGCMQYIPYSHAKGLHPHHHRTANAHALVADQVDTADAVPCALRAGGVTIHLPTTLHYSGPNHTDTVRRAWVLLFSPYGRIGLFRPVHLMAKFRTFLKHRAPRMMPSGKAGQQIAGLRTTSSSQ